MSTADTDPDPDPLEIKQLALSYDYLIYKINDHIANLADDTYETIRHKQSLIEINYFEDQLDLPGQLQEVDRLLEQCNQLELDFLKLDQLRMFIGDFKNRIDALERGFDELE
ncbi:uncharacterized protein RJT21DRAFT_114667 [Scheffersomyces amazonensis]|uniref:uncharacterized protein n=1 Tax=Scheffersomyces amazonensis TaxID=1078765 RepID=UPI00315C6BFE